MLGYDLTQTQLFESASRDELPTEAEMFVLTVALLLVRDPAYSDLEQRELGIADGDVTPLAECIEYRLSALVSDFGDPHQLRDRLRRFVGLRIGAVLPDAQTRCKKPT